MEKLNLNEMFFTLPQITMNGYGLGWATILSILAVSLAVSTISSKNPINSVLFLIGLFVVISLYLVIFDMTFIGLSYLLVYVGAVSILFLFIVMLINVRISELLTEGRNSLVLAVLVVVFFGFIFNDKFPYLLEVYENLTSYIATTTGTGTGKLNNEGVNGLTIELLTGLGSNMSHASIVVSKNWDNSLTEITHISGIGNVLYSVLFINLLVIGMILLVAMVGAIAITVNPNQEAGTGTGTETETDESDKLGNGPDYLRRSPF